MSLLRTEEGTVSIWFKVDTAIHKTGTPTMVVFHVGSPTQPDWLAVYKDTNGRFVACVNALQVYMPLAFSPASSYEILLGESLSEGFYLVDVTWDAQGTKVYLNGVLKGSVDVKAAIYSDSQLAVGNWLHGIGQFNGVLDNVQLFSRARIDTEIAAAYASNAPPPVDEDTTYKLNFNNSLAFQIYNCGTFETPLIVEVRGIVTNPEISIGGKTLRYEGTVGETDLLVIDTDKMTVTFNGINAMASFIGSFPKLPPGETEVIAPVGGSTTFKWRGRWL